MPAGLSNSEYEEWLQGTAADSCGTLNELITENTTGGIESYSDVNAICIFMQNTDETAIADFVRIQYQGVDDEQNPWMAVDVRETTNLERVLNNGPVPDKIKRPIGS